MFANQENEFKQLMRDLDHERGLTDEDIAEFEAEKDRILKKIEERESKEKEERKVAI